MWIDLPFDINIIYLYDVHTILEFYAISNAKFILYFILLKMYHKITKIYKEKVESTDTFLLSFLIIKITCYIYSNN